MSAPPARVRIVDLRTGMSDLECRKMLPLLANWWAAEDRSLKAVYLAAYKALHDLSYTARLDLSGLGTDSLLQGIRIFTALDERLAEKRPFQAEVFRRLACALEDECVDREADWLRFYVDHVKEMNGGERNCH